jgi:DNA (cytosine-5)-methyltransferase 1
MALSVSRMKILNLYAGIGGNRKLWQDVEVTAVELNPQIAKIYSDFFPQDKVIVADAHQYLLEHFKEYEFIWSSPPCPSHSKINKCFTEGNATNPIVYPDMALYQEIILCRHYYKGKYCIENVIGFYEPLIKPQERCSHYFWTNFHIGDFPSSGTREHYGGIDALEKLKGFDIKKYSGIDKIKTLRNCVQPNLGLHILNESKREEYQELFK